MMIVVIMTHRSMLCRLNILARLSRIHHLITTIHSVFNDMMSCLPLISTSTIIRNVLLLLMVILRCRFDMCLIRAYNVSSMVN